MSRPIDYGAEVVQSGMAFDRGDLRVVVDSGSSDDGDRLRFLVIRAWPRTTPLAERRVDPRFDGNSGGLPLVRNSDGVMRPVRTDGRVYLFTGDELRTVRVVMNEQNAADVTLADALEGMWERLQQFRVDEPG